MHLRVLAVGDRQPQWVDDAVAIYAARLPREWAFRIDVLPAARRTRSIPRSKSRDDEGKRLLDRLGRDEQLILLDEQGRSVGSKGLARKLDGWQFDGRDIAFVIGGPDGVSAAVRERAAFVWSLSPLTLPHGMARVLLIEQLYRAWTVNSGHPYHRE